MAYNYNYNFRANPNGNNNGQQQQYGRNYNYAYPNSNNGNTAPPQQQQQQQQHQQQHQQPQPVQNVMYSSNVSPNVGGGVSSTMTGNAGTSNSNTNVASAASPTIVKVPPRPKALPSTTGVDLRTAHNTNQTVATMAQPPPLQQQQQLSQPRYGNPTSTSATMTSNMSANNYINNPPSYPPVYNAATTPNYPNNTYTPQYQQQPPPSQQQQPPQPQPNYYNPTNAHPPQPPTSFTTNYQQPMQPQPGRPSLMNTQVQPSPYNLGPRSNTVGPVGGFNPRGMPPGYPPAMNMGGGGPNGNMSSMGGGMLPGRKKTTLKFVILGNSG